MAFLIGGANSDSGAYQIENSLRFNDDDSPKLAITPGSAGNRKIFTISFWVKRGNITDQMNIFGTASEGDALYFASDDKLRFFQNGSASSYFGTNRLFRDPAAWYHIVVAVDTNQGTAANRVKLYINGSSYGWDASTTYPAEDYEGDINNTADAHMIGNAHHNDYFDGYLADFYFIDGTQYAASTFGETDDNGVWVPINASPTFGSNGFLCEFKQTGTGTASASTISADTSGNDNHLTSTNLAATDVCTDTPTNNFATLNPLITPFSQTNPTWSEGNCKYVTGLNQPAGVSTMAMENGKWYWEIKKGSTVDNPAFGVVGSGYAEGFGTNDYGDADSTVIQAKKSYHENGDRIGYSNNGSDVYKNGAAQSYGSFDAIASGDIFMVALDMDNNKIWIGNNGTWLGSGDPAGGSNEVATLTNNSFYNRAVGSQLAAVDSPAGGDVDWEINFGNPSFSISSGNADGNGYGNFEYAVPSGFYALCTKNLAEYG